MGNSFLEQGVFVRWHPEVRCQDRPLHRYPPWTGSQKVVRSGGGPSVLIVGHS